MAITGIRQLAAPTAAAKARHGHHVNTGCAMVSTLLNLPRKGKSRSAFAFLQAGWYYPQHSGAKSDATPHS
jgi:hypothetical protein